MSAPDSLQACRVGADVGGTFTDVVLASDDGRVELRKVPSTPPHFEHGVLAAVADLADPRALADITHATTVATNTVLERSGPRTALLTTTGFRDVLELRRVRIPSLYDAGWRKPPALVERRLRFEVDERIAADGTVLRPLDEDQVRALAVRLRAAGVDTVAVCLLHAHRHPAHERRVGELLAAEGPELRVTLSSDVLREEREYERTATTAVNAYVRPVLERYLERLRDGLRERGVRAPLWVMRSSGGVMRADEAARLPVMALESGPAAGVLAAQRLGTDLGIADLIAFDMGGTTAKAALVEDGRIARRLEYEVGADISAGPTLLGGNGDVIRVPTLDISEIGAGGGSVAEVDTAGVLRVGPRSAGAVPGPACYGLGGREATVTDANVVLGYMAPGPIGDGSVVVDAQTARAALEPLAARLEVPVEDAAAAVREVANATMGRVIRSVSSERGRDPAAHALVAYGGAGPLHAVALAEDLGIPSVVVPAHAGLFSAIGLLRAPREVHDVRSVRIRVQADRAHEVDALVRELRDAVEAALDAPDEVQLWCEMRFEGQSWDLEVALPPGPVTAATLEELARRFGEEHERRYGVVPASGAPVELRALRATGRIARPEPRLAPLPDGVPSAGPRRAWFRGRLVEVPVLRRADLAGAPVEGPLLVADADTTVVVPDGWRARREPGGALRLDDVRTAAGRSSAMGAPARRSVLELALASAAEEMATTIYRTAHSTIVRDVMDFSAALCDPRGETVAQAVTIPFHLGSFPTAMRTLLDHVRDDVRPGDVFAMNDPFGGGMHTSDIHVVRPLFAASRLLGFAVTVAHHGDVGGRVPGTTATDNSDIFQEGIRLPWVRLVEAGRPVEDLLRVLALNVRIPRMMRGDLDAQIAACDIAVRRVEELAERHGPGGVAAAMTAIVDDAETVMRAEIASWPDGAATFVDHLDSDGVEDRDVRIGARVTIAGDEITVDLSDSSPMVRGSLNAPPSFSAASAYHAVLCAVRRPLPHSSGAFRAIRVVTRPGTVVHVVSPAASSMRGVTGFRIVDAVNGALAGLLPGHVSAAGEGGNTLAIFSEQGVAAPFLFYELIVGTWGARSGADGNDGASNPCATAANIPVEVAEADFPIRIERYGLVPDSGGAGRWRGGLAVARSWRSLRDGVMLHVRSDRARHRPYGLAGGRPGRPAENAVERADGRIERFAAMFTTTLGAGDVFHHVMAAGGGWGPPAERPVADILRDVADGKLSPGAAKRDYGVDIRDDSTLDAAPNHPQQGEPAIA